MTFQSKVHQMF